MLNGIEDGNKTGIIITAIIAIAVSTTIGFYNYQVYSTTREYAKAGLVECPYVRDYVPRGDSPMGTYWTKEDACRK